MAENEFLQAPRDEQYPTLERLPSSYRPTKRFHLSGSDQKQYQQQFGDMYFYRLAKLKPAAEQTGSEAWSDLEVAGEPVRKKQRVLDVRQGELCWVVGTIYMDMPLKPNILDDISKDHWISAPPPREKYVSPSGQDLIMLEDDSGRLRLVGPTVQSIMLVTGCIVAVMGTENIDGEFEVIDLKVPDLPRQPPRWEQDDSDLALANATGNKRKAPHREQRASGKKVAIISGLSISGHEAEGLTVDLLMEYLLGEATGLAEQQDVSKITRLVIAGNSISSTPTTSGQDEVKGRKASKKYGYDASAYNPAPTAHLDSFLAALLPSIPITLIPGESDPANVSIPQQPLHPTMLPRSKNYVNLPDDSSPSWLDSTTNPWEGDIEGWRFMGNGGQPVDDIFKYVEGEDRLEMMECLLRWRISAPTAPDTLWCYPYQDEEPFLVEETPHVFFVGNQPHFDTTVIEGPIGQAVRLIAVPKFKETGQLLLLDMDSLEVEIVKFDIFDEV